MKKFICTICGYVHTGDAPPEKCPVCGAPASKFNELKESDLSWADEHRIGVANGLDPEIVNGLRESFTISCTEAGIYLSMSRQADREGYPEVAEALKRYSLEKADHASKFAELLGEVVYADTKKNLTLRVEAESRGTESKFKIAKKAKQLDYDAVHDTVHEMSKDAARHGRGLEGLLSRYFK